MSLVRVLGFASVLAAGAAGAQSVAPFAYAPGTYKYRVTTNVDRTQIQGGGRAPFQFETTTQELVTVDIKPASRDTLRVTFRVDSIHVKSDLAAPSPNTDSLVGVSVSGTMSPQGRIYQFGAPAGNSDARTTALYNAFRRFLVSLPSSTLHQGSTWADTLSESARRGGFDVTTVVTTQSQISKDTTVAGRRVWKVDRRSEITQQGTGTQQEGGQTVHLEGDGSITGFHLVTPDGLFLGSQSTQRVDVQMMTAESQGGTITQTIKSKVEMVK